MVEWMGGPRRTRVDRGVCARGEDARGRRGVGVMIREAR